MAMAAASGVVFSVRPPMPSIRPCAASSSGKPEASAGRLRADGKWWAPLFGWSGQADYIDGASSAAAAETEERPRARRFTGLTEEKAKELRMRMMETETFHDAMYHSAIASRLASASASASAVPKGRRSG